MRKGGAIEHNFLEDVGPHLDVFRDALHILLVSDLWLEALPTKRIEPAETVATGAFIGASEPETM